MAIASGISNCILQCVCKSTLDKKAVCDGCVWKVQMIQTLRDLPW